MIEWWDLIVNEIINISIFCSKAGIHNKITILMIINFVFLLQHILYKVKKDFPSLFPHF